MAYEISNKQPKARKSTTRLIAFGFAMIILTGTLLLTLPFANKDWFETLTATTIGQLMLSISAASIFFSAARVVKLTKPIEYRR